MIGFKEIFDVRFAIKISSLNRTKGEEEDSNF